MGTAGNRVVIEEFLDGEEASFIVLADASTCSLLRRARTTSVSGTATGANTGGMGAYSPAPIVTPDLHARVVREIIQPVLSGMVEEATATSGSSTPAS